MPNPYKVTGARELRLAAWAGRLAVLLKETDDPEYEMSEAASRMEDGGVLAGEPNQMSPDSFANLVIAENPLLFDQMGPMYSVDDPSVFETSGDLISNLLPSNNALD